MSLYSFWGGQKAWCVDGYYVLKIKMIRACTAITQIKKVFGIAQSNYFFENS
jgi:hypothetical protein